MYAKDGMQTIHNFITMANVTELNISLTHNTIKAGKDNKKVTYMLNTTLCNKCAFS